MPLFAWCVDHRDLRSFPPRRSSDLAAARDHEALAGLGEIAQPLAGGFVVDHRADGDIELDGMAFRAGTVAAFAMASALGFVLRVEAVLQEGVFMRVGHQHDVAAAAAIAAAGATARHVLLAPEGHAAITAVAE